MVLMVANAKLSVLTVANAKISVYGVAINGYNYNA